MGLYGTFGGLTRYLKTPSLVYGNAIFRIHYMLTPIIILCCCLLMLILEVFGGNIRCISNGYVEDYVINNYCWVTTTFAMANPFNRPVGTEVAYPGVSTVDEGYRVQNYHAYYQWVVPVLLLQAILCYLPHWIWKQLEDGLMKTLMMGLKARSMGPGGNDGKDESLLYYLRHHLKQHNMYALKYYLCEFLCLINIIAQLCFINTFLRGQFFTSVLEFANKPQEERTDPMVFVFPRVTKCSFPKYGPSGTIQLHDAICMLPINIVNEKSYIFIWFWFIGLAVLLSLLLIFRIIIMAVPSIRPILFHARNHMVPRDQADVICRNTSLGDWWALYMLGRNLDPLIYREVIEELSAEIETANSKMYIAGSSYEKPPRR